MLQKENIIQHFQHIITKDDSFPEKPNPASFIHIIETFKLKTENTFAIGDREIDIIAGTKANIKTILFNKHNVQIKSANYYIHDHYDIKNIIKST